MTTKTRKAKTPVLPEDTSAIRVERFTPDYCAEILDHSNHNIRRFRAEKAAQYAADMAAGRWAVGLGVIGFNPAGDLVDGQHRFGGCVMANVPFESLCNRNVSPEAVDNADRGLKRSVADLLRAHGEVGVTSLQAGLNLGYKWDVAGVGTRITPTWEQLEVYLAENPDYRDAVSAAHPLLHRPLHVRTVIIPFIVRVRRIDYTAAEQFVHRLHTGTNLALDDPIWRLREAFLARRSDTNRPRTYDLALAIKAWNAFICGQKLKTLTWNPLGRRNEAFPFLSGPDGTPWPFPDYLRSLTDD
jgi:hypothetical protein